VTPVFTKLLLRLVLRGEGSEFVLGDMEEDYRTLLEREGRRAANAWYREQAVASAFAWINRGGEAVMRGLLRDVRYGARALVRSSGYSAAAALTLGLGLGGAVAVIALGRTLSSPLPFPDAHELVAVWETRGGGRRSVAPANYIDWRQASSMFSGLAAHDTRSASMTVDGVASRGGVAVVSGNFFAVLEVDAALGRTFRPELNTAFSGREAVLSHARWTDQFGGDPSVIGKTFQVDEVSYEVVGVAPAGLAFPTPDTDAWLRSPTEAPEIAGFPGDLTVMRDAWYFEVFGRLDDGVALSAATAEMDAISTRLAETFPDTNATAGTDLVSLLEQTVSGFRATLIALALAVALVMIAAMVNVTHLMLARSEARAEEMSVRTALGAGRKTLLRQVATEGGLLGFAGGGVAVVFAYGAVAAGTRWLSSTLPRAHEVSVNASTSVAALLLGTCAGVAVALVAHMAQRRSTRSLNSSGSRTLAGASAQKGLVAMQVAAAIALLAGAGLLGRSLQGLAAVDLGIAADEVVTLRVAVPDARGRAYTERLQEYDRLALAVGSLPGVESVGYGASSPLTVGPRAGVFMLGEERPFDPPDAGWQPVTSTYFDALGMTLLDGRGFETSDREDSPDVGIVNEALVRAAFAGADPIGKQITIGLDGHDRPITIVGVVADTRTRGPAAAPAGVLYRPISQTTRHSATTAFFAVRSSIADGALMSRVRDEIRATAPSLPVYGEALGTDLARPFRAAQATLLGVLAVFAVTALLLGAVGVYGVAAYSVRRRRREIGVRMALGADRTNVVGHVVKSGLLQAAVGVPFGIGLTWALGRALSSVLFAVEPADVRSLAAACVVVLGVATLALLIPAGSAARTDPAAATRGD
jgi:putative ABC transport system permease protein